jgi:large subunit ribosomal protein L29
MKAADLRQKTEDQLKADLLALRKEQMNFRFQKSTGQLENVSRVTAARRNVARVKTVLNQIKQGKLPAAAKAAKPAAKKKKAKE